MPARLKVTAHTGPAQQHDTTPAQAQHSQMIAHTDHELGLGARSRPGIASPPPFAAAAAAAAVAARGLLWPTLYTVGAAADQAGL